MICGFKKFLLLISVAGIHTAQSAFAEEPLKAQPKFGKNYGGGLVQKWLLAQNSSSKTTPSTKADEPKTEGLNLDAPQLETKKDEGASVGPFSNLNFGGALDMRLYFPRPGGPTDSHLGMANFDIHVSELFLTTNIGDHISILAEQLLITSKMGSTVGQDHGFVYAVFSSIPGLPEDIALKVGRMRYRFGADSKLDSPANTLRSPVYKSIGTITDKGIELSGLLGPVEWSVGVMNGVDSAKYEVIATNGQTVEMEADIRNGSKPVVARLGWDVTDNFSLGLSGFTGKNYPITSHYGFAMHDMVFNGHTDESRLVYKNRGAIDAKLRISSRLDLTSELSYGTDRDNGQTYTVWTAYGRIDYRIIPQKLNAQFQYEYFDDGRGIAVVDGMPYKDSGSFGLGLAYFLTDQAWIRASFQIDDRGLFRSTEGNTNAPEFLGTIQTMLSF